MDNLEDIVENMSHVGMANSVEDLHLNQYIITSLQSGVNTAATRIGRVVQIRTDGSEHLGSMVVLIRHVDDVLTSHYNQCYVPLKGADLKRVKKAFEDAEVYLDNPNERPYSICDEDNVKGFIVTPEDIKAQKIIDERDSKIENFILK